MPTTRRRFLAGTAAALAAPRIAAAQGSRVLKFIPHADLTVVDPSWSATYITRNFAMMAYDTLYGTDASFNVSPQMAAGHVIEDDGKTWVITLRDGLKFHDGTPVLARDAAASITRWGQRDNMGQTVADRTDEVSAVDDKRIKVRLKQPFPLLAAALGKPGSMVCAIMPERLAAGDRGKPITEVNQLERPLRAMTARGERICLARSEIIPAGATLTFTLQWLTNNSQKSTQNITEEALLWALDYGALKGFGQWRGGGFGRFTYEISGWHRRTEPLHAGQRGASA